MRLEDINTLGQEGFETLFRDVVEASPWVARAAAGKRPFPSVDELVDAFTATLLAADSGQQRAVINAHPDLGARLDDLSEASAGEQQGAGLATLSPTGRVRLRELNEAYKVKFGFPFLFAVAGRTAEDVVRAFDERLPNDAETEFRIALSQVLLIIQNRLRSRVA